MLNRKNIFCIVAALALGAALSYGFFDSLSEDEAFELEQLAGLLLLTFVALGAIFIMVLFGFSEVLHNLMEARGDAYRMRGRLNKARIWYERCLWLDDKFLSHSWKRIAVMGKLSGIYEELGKRHMAKNMTDLAEMGRIDCQSQECSDSPASNLAPEITRSWCYRYLFLILFGAVSIAQYLGGCMHSAIIVLFVGIFLNAYWLVREQD